MATPRPQKARTWTRADHQDNAQRIQRDADRRLFRKLGRAIGVSEMLLNATLARLIDERIAAALRAHFPPLIDQLKAPPDAAALRDALFDAISDNVVEMFQILNGQVTEDDTRDTEETPASGGENPTFEQREIYPPDEQEA